jgi:hypothetical protein
MLSRLGCVAAVLVTLASAGCSTTLSTLQPAEPMRPGHVQANAAVDVNVPASRIVDAIDVVADLGKRYVSDPGYRPSDEEQRQALAAGVGLAVSAPGVSPDVMLRVGVLKHLDVGVRWSGVAAHADAKYRFFATKDASAADEQAVDRVGDGPDRGFQGAVSLGVSKDIYSGFAFEALEYLKVVHYSRWNIELPVIFGARLGRFGHYWFGPKYVLSTYSIGASLKNIGIVPSASGAIHHLGAFGGVGVGYKVVFVFFELTIMEMFAEPEIFGRRTDLGGIVAAPAGGLMLRL